MGFGKLNRLIGFYTHAQKDLISSAEFMAGTRGNYINFCSGL